MAEFAAQGTDDTDGQRFGQAEGVADGDDPFADLQFVRVAQIHGGQALCIVDLQYGHIGLAVGADQFDTLKLTAVAQDDMNFIGIVDNVVVGQDVTVLADNET